MDTKFVRRFHDLVVECHYCGNRMMIRKIQDDTVEAKCLVCEKDLDRYFRSMNNIKDLFGDFKNLVDKEFEREYED